MLRSSISAPNSSRPPSRAAAVSCRQPRMLPRSTPYARPPVAVDLARQVEADRHQAVPVLLAPGQSLERPLPAPVELEATALAPQAHAQVRERRGVGDAVHVPEVRGDEQVALAAPRRERHALHLQPGALEQLACRLLHRVGIALAGRAAGS